MTMNAKLLTAVTSVMIGSSVIAGEFYDPWMYHELPEIVVEASRLDFSSPDIPRNVQVFSREEIAKIAPANLTDFLYKSAPSVTLNGMGGNNPALKDISMRGYGENGFGRVLVLVDGERLNNPDMLSPNLSQVPLFSVRQIEIIDGPSSVLHGDNASAGLINIITDNDDYETHGKIETHGGSWHTLGANAAIRGGDKAFGILYWANGGYDHSDGFRKRTGYDIYNTNAGIKQIWDNGSFLRLSVFHNDSDYELPGGISRDEWLHDPQKPGFYLDDYYRRITYGANLQAEFKPDEENRIRLSQTLSRRHTRSLAWGTSEVDYDMYSYSFRPEWISTEKFIDFENEFLLGGEFSFDRLHAWGTYNGKYEVNRANLAVFSQDTLHLTDRLALQVGARYQRSRNEITLLNHPRRFNHLHAAEGALLFTPVDDLKTYLKASRFFRSPFVDEYVSNVYYSPDKMLSPETGYDLEAGFDYSFAQDFNVAGNLYSTKTEHEIFYDPYFSFNNINYRANTIRRGFNFRASWEHDKLAGISLGYNFVHAQYDGGPYDGKRVTLVPAHTALISARVWLWDDCFVFGGYRYQSMRYSASDFNNDGAYAPSKRLGTIPAFGIAHIGIEYDPSFASLEGWKFRFTIDNLFDKNYCEYASYGTQFYPGAGRMYMASISYEF